MSSKRGRKRNDNLPPNRARDVQRAFRARRAAHLQALEQRVSELEEENSCLRQALNLPPANRPALGKGPTGKDKPKSFDSSSRLQSSRDSSSADSPTSSRANSLSPSIITASMRTPPRSVQMLESSNWDQSMLMQEQQADIVPASSSSSYQLPAVSTSLSSKPLQYPPYSHSIPGPSRSSMSSGMYISSAQPTYLPSGDRPMTSPYDNSGFMTRNDIRDDSQQQQYSYPQPQFTPSHDSGMPPHGPHATSPLHAQPQRESFPHRRSLTTPQQGFRAIVNQFPHLPNPTHGLGHTMRANSPRLQDNGNTHLGGAYDGRLNTMS